MRIPSPLLDGFACSRILIVLILSIPSLKPQVLLLASGGSDVNQDITRMPNPSKETHLYLHAPKYLLFTGLIVTVIVLCSAKISATGTLDPTFGSGGKVTTNFGGRDYGTAILVQLDGKIVVVGTAYDQPTGTGFAADSRSLRRKSDGRGRKLKIKAITICNPLSMDDGL